MEPEEVQGVATRSSLCSGCDRMLKRIRDELVHQSEDSPSTPFAFSPFGNERWYPTSGHPHNDKWFTGMLEATAYDPAAGCCFCQLWIKLNRDRGLELTVEALHHVPWDSATLHRTEHSAEHESDRYDSYCILSSDVNRFEWAWQPSIFGVIHVAPSTEASYRLIDLTMPSQLDTSKVKNWIAQCTVHHGGRCTPEFQYHLTDLRVIDCVERTVIAAPTSCHFVALSYVWGASDTHNLFKDLRQDDKVPATVQDSIGIVMELGYRYLWVDRYCIDQEDGRQKHTQIVQMGRIYASAQLTIIAAAGNDPTYGLPGARLRRSSQGGRVGDWHLTLVPSTKGFDDVLESKWASRAWTFQEGFFSKRRLIFTDRQAIFLCNTSCSYEVPTDSSVVEKDRIASKGLIPQGHFLEVPRPGGNSPLLRPMNYLEEYSRRTLTYDTDALDAIIGALHADRHISHVWGAPFRPYQVVNAEGFRPVEIAILWIHPQSARRRHGFPSWSSIGWEGRISWLGTLRPSEQDSICLNHAKVGDIYLDSFPARLLPDIDSGHISQRLTISALTASFTAAHSTQIITSTEQTAEFPEDSMVVSLPWKKGSLVFFWPHWDIDSSDIQAQTALKGIILQGKDIDSFRNNFEVVLLLRLCSDHYERIGTFKLPSSHHALFGQPFETSRVPWLGTYVVCDASVRQQTQAGISEICGSDPAVTNYNHSLTELYWKNHFVRETISLG